VLYPLLLAACTLSPANDRLVRDTFAAWTHVSRDVLRHPSHTSAQDDMTLDAKSLVIATAIGTVLQVAMVVAGHSNPAVAKLFAVGGMGFSLVAGVIYAWRAHPAAMSDAVAGGTIAGAACALLGILVSFLLGDVPATLLALGTISSAVTGAVGGVIGRSIGR